MNTHPRYISTRSAFWASLSLLLVPCLYGQSENGTDPKKPTEATADGGSAQTSDPAHIAPFEEYMAIVVNAGLDLADRSEAADQIVEMTQLFPDVAPLLGHVFLDTDFDLESARILAGAVARQPFASDALATPLIGLAGRMSESEVGDVIAALGSIHSQQSCAALIDFASLSRPAAIRARAFDALWRLTAMRSLGVDIGAWQTWFGKASGLSSDEWNLLLLSNLARERDYLVSTRALDIARLIEVATQLNLATPSENRSALLASYLLDSRDEMRVLGFDLVERELRQSSQLNGEVASATIALLSHADPAARRRAAQIIDQIAPAEAGPAITKALEQEFDSAVAAELLKACIRWPSAELEESVVRWMLSGGETFSPASRASLGLLNSGFLQDHTTLVLIADALRSRAIETLSEPSLSLLAAVGEDADREKIGTILESDNPQSSRAAAIALSGRAEYLDRLLTAAVNRADLLSIAAEAVLKLRPTATGYTSVQTLLEPSEGEVRDNSWLLRIAQALNLADLHAVAILERDLAFREQLLIIAARDDRVVAETERDSFAAAMTELADLQVSRGQPDSALLTLDRVLVAPELLAPRIVHLRAIALITTNRLDEARQLSPVAETWLRALELILELAPDPIVASAIVVELESNFADALTDDQTARFALLDPAVKRLVATSGPPDSGAPPPAEKSGGGDDGGG